MANTNNILAAFAIVFLTCLSLSSAFVKHDLDIPNALKKHETQTFLREKREKEVEAEYFNNNNPLELEEEVSEPTFVAYDKREAIGEEAKERGQKDDEKNEEQEKPNTRKTTSKSNNVEEEEEGAKDDVFSYRDMHDLIQALILADKEDIAERLQQLREAENATKFEISSNLPKRQAIASTAAAAAAAAAASSASSDLLGTDLWDVVPLTDLDAHSCEVEAFSHGHSHVSGTIVHEFFCELRKLWHYGLIVLRNFKSELSLGPLIAGEVVTDGIFGHLFHHTSHLLHAVIREPHHLLILPDIIRDAVPFPSITGAIHRLKHVFFKVLDFVCDLVRGHVSHIFRHLFSHHHHHHHHHLGVRLREKLHHLEGFGSILPLEEMIAEPILPTAASATTATATATATASSDGPVIVSDYQRSLAEVLSSFRGFYDGYHASGLPHLIRTGARSFFTSPIYSRMSSYLPFFNHFGCGPIQEATTTTSTVTTSSASSSVGIDSGSIVGPIVSPIAPIVAPVESEIASSSTASATATATATVAETPQPVISAGPTIVPLTTIPYESTSSTAAAATATATATAAASPVIESSSYQTVPQVYAPIVVEEIAVPAVLENNAVAATSAAASAAASTAASAAATSSAANVVPNPIVERVPLVSPLRRHRLRPGLSTVAPAAATAAAAAAATASASASSTQSGDGSLLEPARYRGLDLDIDRRIRYPSIRPRVSHVVTVPSSTASSAAAASASAGSQASSAVASSSASTVSSDGFNLVLPREQIVGALGYDYLLPGDVISVTLRNKSILFGRVLDTTSPITFTFLRPKVRASLLRHGGRVWNLLPRDFKDPECVRKFNNPLLLRYGL